MNSINFLKFARRNFSVLPKAPKLELTMRSPYRTFFKNFIGFQRVYVGTIEGQVAIQNRTPPVIYLLPAGEIKVINLLKTEGNYCDANSSGEFVHSGGIAIIHDNNTCDINLYECVEKEKFAYDKVDSSAALTFESDSKYDKEAALYAIKKTLKKK